jgi:endonuclease I
MKAINPISSYLVVLAGLSISIGSAGAAIGAVPAGYYDEVDASTSTSLRLTLHEVIDDHVWFPYTDSSTDTWDIVNDADEDPNDPGAIVDVYRNASYGKISGGIGAYNREHTWPRSYGFPDNGDLNYPFTDCHHLFASDPDYNSARENRPYRYCHSGCEELPTETTNGRGGTSGTYPSESNWTQGAYTDGTWETWSGRRGDIARAMFYMAIRYEGGNHGITGAPEPDLELTDNQSLIEAYQTGENESVAYMGMLSDLLVWHAEDPVDDNELHRNDVVMSYQGNRNPFVDHPEWAACVFGGACTSDSIAPNAPLGLLAIPGVHQVALEWAANNEPDFLSYTAYRGTVQGGPYNRLASVTTESYQDQTVSGGTDYFYVVTASDTSGNESEPSDEVSATPTGTTAAGPIVLSEVLYDVSSSDDGFEWVELFNAGTSAVNLSSYSLGNGGEDYTYSKVQLSGTIQPGQTFVVGGPSKSSNNGYPTYNLVVNFDPDFQNSGTAADGVALFDRPTHQVNASTVPIDAVVYGPTNSNGLKDETGSARSPEVGDASPNYSIERVTLGGSWTIQRNPTPNSTPLEAANSPPSVSILSPSSGSSFAQGESVVFSGSATDPEDGSLNSSIQWSSNRDGTLGSGQSITVSTLSPGQHSIQARVSDSSGSTASAGITVTIEESAPCSNETWIEIAAKANGAFGSTWRTSLALRNTGSTEATVELWFNSDRGESTLSLAVDPGAQASFDDLIGTMNAVGTGPLRICSDQPLSAAARTYNQSQDGTFGQFFRAYSPNEGLSAGQTAQLLGLRQQEGVFRTNLSVTNTGDSTGQVTVHLYNAAGTKLWSYSLTVEPSEVVQDLEPFDARANAPNLGWGFATVTVNTGSGILTSASVIDSRTNDATTVPMVR